MTSFPDLLAPLPDDARTWLYVADRALSPAEQSALVAAMERFFASWHTHRIPVAGAAAVLFDRVLVVAGAVEGGDASALSGCGIDQHTRELGRLGAGLGVTWLDGLHVAFFEGGRWHVLPRAEARAALAAGTIPPSAHVLDVTAASLGAVRRGDALPPLARSAFARWLPVATP